MCLQRINSSAVGAHARKYKKPPSSRLQQNTKQKINKKLRCILIDKNIHPYAHHRNSGKLDDTDRAEERKRERQTSEVDPILEQRFLILGIGNYEETS